MNRAIGRDRDFITSGLYGLLIGDALSRAVLVPQLILHSPSRPDRVRAASRIPAQPSRRSARHLV